MTDATAFFDTLVRLEIELWNEIDARLHDDDGVTLARFQAPQRRGTSTTAGPACTRSHRISASRSARPASSSTGSSSDGTARREPNPDDRRSSLIALTPDGVRRHAAATATFAAAAEAALPADLRGDELDALTRRLDGVAGTWPAWRGGDGMSATMRAVVVDAPGRPRSSRCATCRSPPRSRDGS